MARDVAQRERDQAGFRITNLGDPQQRGDATRTDNDSLPQPNQGSGAAGSSLLAAPADHVHPANDAGHGTIEIHDPTEQSVTGENEELVSEYLTVFPGKFSSILIRPLFGAVAKVTSGSATVKLRVGGTPGQVDGNVVGSFSVSSTTFAIALVTAGMFDTPIRPELVKVTIACDGPDRTCFVRAKSISFRE